MVKTAATVGFIAVVTVAGIAVALEPTVVDGRVMAADLLPQLKRSNAKLERIECDRSIPITVDGARFECLLHEDGGAAIRIEYTMARTGALSARLLKR
ncbi:MAG: hypothetical protein ABI867_22385 [Kofleriaceae bacterium]